MHPEQQPAQPDARLERAVRGDPEAIEAILAPYLPRLRAFAARRLSHQLARKESAADIVQSTCREVLVDLQAFDAHGEGESAFKSWLFRTTVRKLRDRERYYRRQRRDANREVPGIGSVAEMLRTTGTPSRAAIDAEARQQIEAALELLPEHYRELIRLVYFEGLSATEIADRLGKSTSAVNSQLARSLARLARVMESRAE